MRATAPSAASISNIDVTVWTSECAWETVYAALRTLFLAVQEAGAGGAALMTRCRGGWCGCRASCGYKSNFWQKSARRGWQQLSELKNEKRGQPVCGTLSIVARTEAKRFAPLRLPKQLPRVQHPSDKEKRGEDEELHATKWHGEECWLPEGAGASREDADVSPSASPHDCTKASKSTAATVEACHYGDAALGREIEVLGKGEKNTRKQNGSKEVLALVKELLLLLLQSLQEALTSLCRRRGATGHEQCEIDALADHTGGNEKRGDGWTRRLKTSSTSFRPSSEVADSSSNSSTCDSDSAATETSSSDGSSSMTNKEALECVAAVERHTHHVRSAGEMDQLAVYTNLFQACIRTRLVPTELPPLQLMHLLRQLMKAQFTEVNGCRQVPNGRNSREQSPSRSQAVAGLKEGKERSSTHDDKPLASLDEALVNAQIRGDSHRENAYVLPKVPPSYAGASVESVDDSQDAGEERRTLSSTPYAGHSIGPLASYREGSLTERLLRGNKDDAMASVYEAAPILVAEEDSNTACRSKTTARASQERCAGIRKFSASSDATKKTSVSPDLKGGTYLPIEAPHSEDAPRQESCGQKPTECTSGGEATESSGETAVRTGQIGDGNVSRNSLRTCSRFRVQPLHEHYTRSRGDTYKQGRGGRGSGCHDRSAEEPACDSGVRTARDGNFEKARAAGADEEALQNASEDQHLAPRRAAAGAIGTIRQRALATGDSASAPHRSDTNLAEKSIADGNMAPCSLLERKAAESRLALLASEILNEHDNTLLLQQGQRWMSEARPENESAKCVTGGLALPSASLQFKEDNVARHLLCEGVVDDDALTYDKHEKQQSASRDPASLPEMQSPSASVKARPAAEVLRRSSRRSRSLAAQVATTSPTPLSGRSTGAFDEGIVEEDVKEVEAEAEGTTLISEKSAVQVDCSQDPASEEHEKSQNSPGQKARTCHSARDCKVRVVEAETAEDEEESNTAKVFSSNSYGVAVHRNEDSLEKLLL